MSARFYSDKDSALDAILIELNRNYGRFESLRPHREPVTNKCYQPRFSSEGQEKPDWVELDVQNAHTILTRDQWKHFDEVAIEEARTNVQAADDLMTRGLRYSLGPNPLGTKYLETKKQSSLNPASLAMEPIAQSDDDAQHYDIDILPLPIIYKEFSFGAREIEASRKNGTSLDASAAVEAARVIAEKKEDLVIGNLSAASVTFGGNQIYGYITHPNRATVTLTNPSTATNWTPQVTFQEVSEMKQALKNMYQGGPYDLYVSLSFDEYLDQDFSSAKGSNTLRERILAMGGIESITTLDRLDSYQMLLVARRTRTVRMVNGFNMRMVQWTERGGWLSKFMMMEMNIPQIRADIQNQIGLAHGSV